MANPARDARDKAQAIWPGASVSRRGRNQIEHQHPSEPNKRMLDVAIGPLHFGPLEDQEIDTAWQPGTAPWDREMLLANYNAFALDDFSAGQTIKYVDPVSGEDIAFQPQQLQYTNDLDQIQPIEDPQSVNAVVTDDELYWTGAFGTDIDLRWQAQPARLDKRLIIQNLAALPAMQQFIIDGGNPVLRLQFIFQHSNGVSLFVNDVEWDEKANNPVETSGIVEFRNSQSDVVWSFNLPRSFESGTPGEFIGTFRLRKTGPNLFVEHLIPVSWLQAASYPVEIDVTVDEDVAAGGDDGSHDSSSGFSSSDNNARIGAGAGKVWDIFTRFTTVAIDGTIDVAYTEIRAGLTDASVGTHDIYAIDEDNSVAPTSAAEFETDDGLHTTATVSWQPGGGSGLTEDVFYQSPSIVSIIQEIVDRGGWSSGNALQIHHDGRSGQNDAWWDFYDFTSAAAAKLHIEYTAAGGPTFKPQHTMWF